MATFLQNIRKIQGEAVYGEEMREAIAEAIQQTMGLDIDGNDGVVFFSLSPVPDTSNDFLLSIVNG